MSNQEHQLTQPSTLTGPLNVRSTSLAVLMIIGVTASLYVARAFFAPLVLGLLISYAMYPVVSFLYHRGRIPKPLGAAVIVALLVTASGYGVLALQGQLVELLEKVPAALEELRSAEDDQPDSGRSVLEKLSNAATEIEKTADKAATSFSQSGSIIVGGDDAESALNPTDGEGSGAGKTSKGPTGENTAVAPSPGLAGTAGNAPVPVVIDRGSGRYINYVVDGSFGFLLLIGQATTVLLLVYFALASGDLYKHKLVRISGDTLSDKKVTVQILEQINRQMRLFLFVTLIGALFVGLLTGLAFWWLGVEQAMLWGVIAGTASIVPYVGPAFVFAASALTAFLQFGSVGQALFVAAISLGITSVQGSLLTPWMTSRTASMNAVVIFISLLFWGWLWGPVGLVVATPILMVIKSVCDHVENLQGVGEIISDERSRPTHA